VARSLRAIEKDFAAAVAEQAPKTRKATGRRKSAADLVVEEASGAAPRPRKKAARKSRAAPAKKRGRASSTPTRRVTGRAPAKRTLAIPAGTEFRLEVWDVKGGGRAATKTTKSSTKRATKKRAAPAKKRSTRKRSTK